MATVTLSEYECRKKLLPDVCIQCGEPATVSVRRNFSWYPPWVIALVLAGVLVAAIVAIVLTKKMLVQVPMCDRHKSHWSTRTMWTFLCFAVVASAAIGGIALLAANDNGPRKDDMVGWVCGGSALALLLWLFLVAILQSTAIRPKLITDRKITLVKVHPEFVRALEDDREQDAQDDEEFDDDQPRQRGKGNKVRDREDDVPKPRKKKDEWYDDE